MNLKDSYIWTDDLIWSQMPIGALANSLRHILKKFYSTDKQIKVLRAKWLLCRNARIKTAKRYSSKPIPAFDNYSSRMIAIGWIKVIDEALGVSK